MPSDLFHLYIDDSGDRDSTKGRNTMKRNDRYDCFALGGVLIPAENVAATKMLIESVKSQFGIEHPLHSWKIRGRREEFSWLNEMPQTARDFLSALEELIKRFEGWTHACVIHRPGYYLRYHEIHGEAMWLLCKTAYSILVERCAKFALSRGRKLAVYVEQTGKKRRQSHSEISRKFAGGWNAVRSTAVPPL